MGVYDTVGEEGIQIKCADQVLKHYVLHDIIDLNDGLYIGYEGYFIVKNKVIIFTGHDHIYTKWGDKVNVDDILDLYSPIAIEVRKSINKYKNSKKRM